MVKGTGRIPHFAQKVMYYPAKELVTKVTKIIDRQGDFNKVTPCQEKVIDYTPHVCPIFAYRKEITK